MSLFCGYDRGGREEVFADVVIGDGVDAVDDIAP